MCIYALKRSRSYVALAEDQGVLIGNKPSWELQGYFFLSFRTGSLERAHFLLVHCSQGCTQCDAFWHVAFALS